MDPTSASPTRSLAITFSRPDVMRVQKVTTDYNPLNRNRHSSSSLMGRSDAVLAAAPSHDATPRFQILPHAPRGKGGDEGKWKNRGKPGIRLWKSSGLLASNSLVSPHRQRCSRCRSSSCSNGRLLPPGTRSGSTGLAFIG